MKILREHHLSSSPTRSRRSPNVVWGWTSVPRWITVRTTTADDPPGWAATPSHPAPSLAPDLGPAHQATTAPTSLSTLKMMGDEGAGWGGRRACVPAHGTFDPLPWALVPRCRGRQAHQETGRGRIPTHPLTEHLFLQGRIRRNHKWVEAQAVWSVLVTLVITVNTT